MKADYIISYSWLILLFSCSTVKTNVEKLNSMLFEESEGTVREIRPTVYCMNRVDDKTFFVKIGYNSTFTEKKIVSRHLEKNSLLQKQPSDKDFFKLEKLEEDVPQEFFPGKESNVATLGPLSIENQYRWKLNDHSLDLSYRENLRKCHDKKLLSREQTFEIHFGSQKSYFVDVYWIDYKYDETQSYLLESSLDGLSFNRLHDINQNEYRAIASESEKSNEPYKFMQKVHLPYKGKWHIRVKRIESDGSYEYRKKILLVE